MSDKTIFGPTNPSPEAQAASGVLRFGSVTGLRPEMEQRYRELHAAAWPEILERIHASNIRNFSIYVAELSGTRYLFSYHEYVGDDHAADMAALESCPHTRRWWKDTDPCQKPITDEQWMPLEMVFHTD